MPIYEIFDIIAQSGVGNVGNAGLVLLQLYISMFFEIMFLFSSMKNRPMVVRVAVSMIPLILIAAYSIVGGIFFSAFLGTGPDLSEMTEIINLTLTQQCISQMMWVVAAFFALTVLYSIVNRMNLLQWLATFSVELLAALSLLVLYGGLLVDNFPFTILDLCGIDIYLARWPIYGYYTLLFKCLVLVISLLLGLVVRERKPKPESDEEIYGDRCGHYEKKVLLYLTKNHLIIGCSLIVFVIFAATLFTTAALRDKSAEMSRIVVVLFAMMLYIVCIGVSLINNALRPRSMKVYRQLLKTGDKETVLRLFCQEVVDAAPLERRVGTNETQIRTEHFLLKRRGVKIWLEPAGERTHDYDYK